MFRFALALPIAGLIAGFACQVSAQGLVLRNTLDNEAAVVDSLIGPDLRMHPDPSVIRTFVEGVDGNAITVAGGAHPLTLCSIHNLFLDTPGDVLDPDQGTVQMWVRIDQMPASFCEDRIRLFGGPFDLYDPIGEEPSGIGIWVGNVADQPRIHFELFAHQLSGVSVRSTSDGWDGAAVGDYLDRWVKITAAWDRSGVHGNPETMVLFVDGDLVATATGNGWGSNFGPRVGIGGSTGINLSNSYAIDDLRVFDRVVDPVYEAAFFWAHPGCEGSAGVPEMGIRTGDLPKVGTHFTITINSLPVNRTCVVMAMLSFNREESNGIPLPFDLTPIGATGCELYLHPQYDALLGNHLGHVDWALYIPNQPALAGQRFFTQALVLDPNANPMGVSLSNACEARIGTYEF